jgi:hypothetical protein
MRLTSRNIGLTRRESQARVWARTHARTHETAYTHCVSADISHHRIALSDPKLLADHNRGKTSLMPNRFVCTE